jgi:hypothetical protein
MGYIENEKKLNGAADTFFVFLFLQLIIITGGLAFSEHM